ncbi:MAG: ArsB/NhaD family transporter [Dehalococcoidia bacterium]
MLFAATIVLVLVRPRGANEAVVCCAGAATMIATGIVGPAAAMRAVFAQWDVLLFFVGLLLTTRVAETAGIIRWAALTAAALAHGSSRRLFVNIVAAGIGLTVLLSNDTTALLLTAVMLELTAQLELEPLPYALVCAFIANSASTALPVSNPLNILVLGAGGAHLKPYLVHMLPATVIVLLLTVGFCWLQFRRDLGGGFAAEAVPAPASAIEKPRFFVAVAALLGVLALAYVAASVFGWPLSIPVVTAGVVLVLVSVTLGRASWRDTTSAPWSIVPFVAGLLVLVRGLETTGFTNELGTGLLRFAGHGNAAGVFGATAASAVGANLLNNLPSGAVMLSALHTAHAGAHPGLLYGTLLGSDVGPNLTVFGSLSSMLWLMLCRRRGVSISAWQFARLGLVLTPLLLIAGAATTAISP